MEQIGQILTNISKEQTPQPSAHTNTDCSDAEDAARLLQERVAELRQKHNSIARRLILSQMEHYDDLRIDGIYTTHANLLVACANSILAPQGKTFIIDDSNKHILRFLLYYFNRCELAKDVFPNTNYDIDKNIMIIGNVGVGKTLLMDAFSLYLKETNNPRFFHNVSQTQMLNSYKLYNHLDKFIYNEACSKNFSGNPHNLCVNDLGLQTNKFYGQDTKFIIDEFIYARYELWTSKRKFAHITTNLNIEEVKQLFVDEYGRLQDRLKMFNVIPMVGESKR